MPNWMLVTGLTVIILTLTKIILDPCLAVCHLCSDSSLSIIDRITTVFLPTVFISRRKQKAAAIEQADKHSPKQTNKDQGDRIFELEKTVKHLL